MAATGESYEGSHEPGTVDLDEVVKHMKENSLQYRMASQTKKFAIGAANFAVANKMLLIVSAVVIFLAAGGVSAWQYFYPQYLRGQVLSLYERGEYREAINTIDQYQAFSQSDSEITYISAMSNFKISEFSQALLDIQMLATMPDTEFQGDVDFTFYQALVEHQDVDSALVAIAKSLEAEPGHMPSILLRGIYSNLEKSAVSTDLKSQYLDQMMGLGSKTSDQYEDQIRVMLMYLANNSHEIFNSVRAGYSEKFLTLANESDTPGYINGFNNSYSLDIRDMVRREDEVNLPLATDIIRLLGLMSAGIFDETSAALAQKIMEEYDAGAAPNDLAGFVVAVHAANQGQYEIASRLFGGVYSNLPGVAQALLNRTTARIQFEPEGFMLVAEDYTNVLGIQSANAIALNNRGFINMWFTENINKAKQDFTQVVNSETYDPTDILPVYNLAQAYLKTGEPKKAIAEFDKVVEVNPAFGDTVLFRGLAHHAAGNFEYAVRDFNSFKLQEPDNVMPYIFSAELFGDSAGYKLALNELRTAIGYQPDNEDLGLILADFYLRADQVQNAENLITSLPPARSGDLMRKLIDGRLQLKLGISDAEDTLKEVYEEYTSRRQSTVSDAVTEKEIEQELQAAVYYLQALGNNNKVDEILELTRTLLPNYQDNIDLLKIRADAFSQKGRDSEALRFVERAVEIDPLDFEAQILLGDVYSSMGRFQDSIKVYKTAQKIRPADLSALYKIENLLDLLNENEELRSIRDQIARVESEQLLRKESEQAISEFEAATSGIAGAGSFGMNDAAQVEQLMATIEEINSTISENPDSGVLYYNRAVVELSINRVAEAINSMARATELEPDNIDFQMGLSEALLRANDFDNAIKVLDQVVELNPNNFEAVYNRAVAYHNGGDETSAVNDYTTAIRLNPAFANAYYNRGTIYVSFAEYYRAIEEFTRVIELRPDDLKPYLARAQVYRLVGDDEKAENDMQAAQLLRASQQGGSS